MRIGYWVQVVPPKELEKGRERVRPGISKKAGPVSVYEEQESESQRQYRLEKYNNVNTKEMKRPLKIHISRIY